MLTVSCFLWGRGQYSEEHVHVLARMASRHLPRHRFVCLADRDVPGIETVRLDREVLRWKKRYAKLTLWREDMREVLGDRVLSLDLDCVITGDLSPLVERDEDVVFWREPGRRASGRYNTSMILLRTGSRPELWDEFPGDGYKSRRVGSDQAWVSDQLGPGLPTWGPEDGVYSFKYDLNRRDLPSDARIVFFHGRPKPWAVSSRWVKEHYR